jgi:tRNA dimethylallyltransferase
MQAWTKKFVPRFLFVFVTKILYYKLNKRGKRKIILKKKEKVMNMLKQNNSKINIIVIVGPTASGKSDFAVNLALEIKSGKSDANKYVKQECIIISADSRQIYRHLDIGSGKITKEEMQDVTHFGLDIAEADQKFTVNDWLIYAEKKIQDATDENKIPIICGGTGLYIDALLYGITDNPAPDYNFRLEYKDKNLEEIKSEIKSINLEFWNGLNNSEQNNKSRLIRKLEILKSNQDFINQNHSRMLKYNILKFVMLAPGLSILEKKINLRLEKRLENNLLVDEVKNLLEKKIYTKERLISFGLEYKYVTQFLLGEIDKESMIDILRLKIFQYAKKQIAWNKRYFYIEKTN